MSQGYFQSDGVKIGYEVFGDGAPTLLLLPAWTIIHSRFWKPQVPYLARHLRVITFDRPGNGKSDRTADPQHTGWPRSPARPGGDGRHRHRSRRLVSLSRGAGVIKLAADYPDRVPGSF